MVTENGRRSSLNPVKSSFLAWIPIATARFQKLNTSTAEYKKYFFILYIWWGLASVKISFCNQLYICFLQSHPQQNSRPHKNMFMQGAQYAPRGSTFCRERSVIVQSSVKHKRCLRALNKSKFKCACSVTRRAMGPMGPVLLLILDKTRHNLPQSWDFDESLVAGGGALLLGALGWPHLQIVAFPEPHRPLSGVLFVSCQC